MRRNVELGIADMAEQWAAGRNGIGIGLVSQTESADASCRKCNGTGETTDEAAIRADERAKAEAEIQRLRVALDSLATDAVGAIECWGSMECEQHGGRLRTSILLAREALGQQGE